MQPLSHSCQADDQMKSTLGIPKLVSDIIDLVLNGEVLSPCSVTTSLLDSYNPIQKMFDSNSSNWCFKISKLCSETPKIHQFTEQSVTSCRRPWEHSKRIYTLYCTFRSIWFRVLACLAAPTVSFGHRYYKWQRHVAVCRKVSRL